MNTTAAEYSHQVKLDHPDFDRVLISFKPILEESTPCWQNSFVTFTFHLSKTDKEVRRSFLPVRRWTEEQTREWYKTISVFPTSFSIDQVFDQAALDLVL